MCVCVCVYIYVHTCVCVYIYIYFFFKCLGGPNSLTNVPLYSSLTKLKLPTLSLVEGYQLGKERFFFKFCVTLATHWWRITSLL